MEDTYFQLNRTNQKELMTDRRKIKSNEVYDIHAIKFSQRKCTS